jgi:outer membrane receptor protein involved in Fe transport
MNRQGFAACGLLTAAVIAWPACAQTPPAKTAPAAAAEEIIVTATRQAKSITKVPISITAFSQKQLDRAGVRTAADIAALTPGFDFNVTTNPTGGGSSSGGSAVISIRGISSVNGDATTGVYIDDTAVQLRNTLNGVSGNSFPRIFDLERVEVDRGPQGTLFGAGAEGGAVRFLTAQPSLTDYSAYVRSEVADTVNGAPSYEIGAAVGGPIVENKLGFRISGWYREDGGYIDHRDYQTGVDDHNDNWQGTEAFRAALIAAPVDWLKITPSYYYQYQHSNDTSVYWTGLSNAESGKFVNGNSLQLPYTDEYNLPAIKAEAVLDDVTINAISSVFLRTNHAEADETNFEYASAGFGLFFPTVPNGNVTSPLLNKTTQNVVTEEVRVQNTDANDRLNWLIGGFYSDSAQHDQEANVDSHFAQVLGELGQTPTGYFGFNPLPGNVIYSGDERTDEYQLAAYGNLSYRILDQLTASAGVRVARDRLAYHLFADGPLNGGPETTAGDQKGTPVTPRFNLSWQPDANDLIYATVAKGYRIGGVNAPIPQTLCAKDLASLGLTNGPETYGSDSLWSYELGTKNRLANGVLEIEASVYHIDWSQIQQKVVLPTCAFAFTQNEGSAASNGFDLKASVRVTPQFLLSAALGYTDANYNQTVNVGNSIVVKSGDTLGQTPWDLTLTANYNFTLPGEHAGYLRVEDIFHSRNTGTFTYQHEDAYDYDPTLVPNPDTNLLNVRVGMLIKGIDVSLFVDNLLNSHPQLGYSHATTTDPIYYATTLRPLTAGLTGTYRF